MEWLQLSSYTQAKYIKKLPGTRIKTSSRQHHFLQGLQNPAKALLRAEAQQLLNAQIARTIYQLVQHSIFLNFLYALNLVFKCCLIIARYN